MIPVLGDTKMARGRSTRASGESPSNAPNDPLSSLLDPPLRPAMPFEGTLTGVLEDIADTKMFLQDLAARPAPTLRRLVIDQAAAPVRRVSRQVQTVLSMRDPERAYVCARRAVRREVLHALKLKRRGRGGGRNKPRSRIKC